MSMTSWMMAALCAVALASCEGPPTAVRPFAIVFVVESDPGVRLRRVRVFVDGEPAGETDSNGLVHTKIYGAPGQRLTIKHDCPDAHEAPSEPKILRLRKIDAVDSSDSPSMEFTLRCKPVSRLAVFIVRAKNGPGLPILLDGEGVARTNGSGVAHFSVRGAPGTEHRVELDTRQHPELLPHSPTHLFALSDGDDIFVINQSFDVETERWRRSRRRTRITKIE
jgi:hypothetical protein